MSEWQDIASAPHEPGKLLLLWDADVAHPEVASWSSKAKAWVLGYNGTDPHPGELTASERVYLPTHWMPLPNPPSPQQGS